MFECSTRKSSFNKFLKNSIHKSVVSPFHLRTCFIGSYQMIDKNNLVAIIAIVLVLLTVWYILSHSPDSVTHMEFYSALSGFLVPLYLFLKLIWDKLSRIEKDLLEVKEQVGFEKGYRQVIKDSRKRK